MSPRLASAVSLRSGKKTVPGLSTDISFRARAYRSSRPPLHRRSLLPRLTCTPRTATRVACQQRRETGMSARYRDCTLTRVIHRPVLSLRMKRARQLTFTDHRMRTGRGGPRPGAGRPRLYKSRVAHRERGRVPGSCPVHVTLRLQRDVPSLRSKRFVRAFRATLLPARERADFRVVHYSLQHGHAHLIVEARSKQALANGMKSVGARLARTVNKVFERRGPVLAERYHGHVLRTPSEVRRALSYVLLNARKHWKQRHGQPPPAGIDDASSSRWFDGWKPKWRTLVRASRGRDSDPSPEVAPARTWLLRQGWRRYGLVDLVETPGASR